MPSCLATPVLQVDTNVIHQVDTQNPDNLFSMWTVFAKCAGSVDQGRRLENLSWRLWTRETICCDETTAPNSTALPKQIRQQSRSSPSDDVPELSGSLDSVVDEEAVEFYSETPALEIARPRIRRQDSCASSRSRKERHLTSDDLEKMVTTIIQCKEPLNAPLPDLVDSCLLRVEAAEECAPRTDRSGSTTSEESCDDSTDAPSLDSNPQQSPPAEMPSSQSHPTIVVRGFSPSTVPICRITSQSQKAPSPSAIPEPKAAPAAQVVQPKGRQARFALGVSSGDDSYSDRESLATKTKVVPQPKKPMFKLGGSSEENTPDSNPKAQLRSIQQQNYANYMNSSAIESEDEDDAVFDESAIDDDDESSEWEDSNEESGKSSVDSKLNFKRIDSTTNLTSRRSLITLMLAQDGQGQRNPRGIASQSTSALPRARTTPNGPGISPNDSDEAPLMMKRGPRPPTMKSINEVPRSGALPIITTTNGIAHQTMLSPRTTRRNMLATELTESLRRHLLWERSQKNATLNAVLKRRHTSHDVANLKHYPTLKEEPAKIYMKKDKIDTTIWGSPNNYYEQGW
ncbi:DUF1752-domain-containing protein [Coniochaeta ligniaria NRRL 30616]|uniref:DUF1752-domain-containing protein n=1 Tax=Coniochaeta ligniaria NRRL 30616 TaxID=1408157 RepID=A0A1J7IBV8_9PEZI|nr:DUF1752-domain-containing protein [Coniochaeta ligniaria NRRL 30616]